MTESKNVVDKFKSQKHPFFHKNRPKITQPRYSPKYLKPHTRSRIKHKVESVVHFGKDAQGKIGFSSDKRQKHLAKIQDERNRIHYHHLLDYTKLLHALGVDVREHVEAFGIDDVELKRVETEIETTDLGLTASQKTALRETLEGFEAVLDRIKFIDAALWSGIIPITGFAQHHHFLSPQHRDLKFKRGYSKIKFLPGYSEKEFRKEALKTYGEIKRISDFVWASVHHENQLVKDVYPHMLEEALKIFKRFVKVEKEIKKHPGVLSALHDDIFKIVTEDILELTQDILRMYDIRLKIYPSIRAEYNVITAHIPGKEDLGPQLKSEQDALRKKKLEYWDQYTKFSEDVIKAYGGKA